MIMVKNFPGMLVPRHNTDPLTQKVVEKACTDGGLFQSFLSHCNAVASVLCCVRSPWRMLYFPVAFPDNNTPV